MPGYQVSDSESPSNRKSPPSDNKSVAIVPPLPGSAESSRSSRSGSSNSKYPSNLSAEDLKHNDSYKKQNGDEIEAMETVPEQEVVVKTGKREEPDKISLLQLFRFADGLDYFLIILGIITAITLGCCVPINLLVYGEVIEDFIEYTIDAAKASLTNGTATSAPVKKCFDRVQPHALYFLILAGVALVSGFLELLCWTTTAQRQTHRIRAKFFASVLNQHIGWYDANQAGQTTSRLAEDVMNIENGIGDKLGSLIMWTSTFFAGYIIGFVSGWKLTLIMLSLMPIMIASAAVMGIMVRKLTTLELTSYAIAGAVAEEVLGAIRTVTAFGAQERETVRYATNLEGARKVAVKRGLVTGVGMGVMFGVIYPAFGLAFWYAVTQMDSGEGFTGGNTMKVTMGVMLGSMSIGYAAPNMQTLAIARGAAASVFKIIDLVSEIDPSSPDGKKPATCSGNVQFTDVTFRYPQRKEVQILKGVSFEARVGQTLALVGSSGCGKSTIISLVQRFYDTESGTVKIDGVDIRELNVKWLRQQIGIVSQEPVLFNETIANNIRYGNHAATQEMIEKAAKEANAHDFIMKLPDKYNTPVGERGTQLSGGQKQRIAIARGILRDPKILLLDEATSALDSTNEALVQAALDKARMGRTTIVIAHRLSTIRNADVILVMDKGLVVESGTHSELLAKNGFYSGLHNAQAHSKMAEVVEEEEEEVEEEIIDDNGRPALVRRSSTRSSIRSEGRSTPVPERKAVWTAKDEEEATKKLPPASIFRIMSMNKPEIGYIIVGCICVFVAGGLMPCFSIIFSGAINNFTNLDRDGQVYQAGLYAVWFALIGIGIAVLTVFQQYCLTVAGEQLTVRLREKVFHAMLYQEMSYYDEAANGVGNLTARLATDAAAVKGASGTQLGVALNAVSTIVLATILALIFGWKLALVVIGFVPFLLLMGWMQRMMLVGLSVANRDVIEMGGKIASEAVTNIRTVASLGLEDTFVAKYTKHFTDSTNTKREVGSCVMFGLSQSVIYFVYTATFIFGAWLIDTGDMDFLNVLRVFSTVTFSAMSLGRAIAYAPDYTKGRLSAAKMFALLDREPAIEVRSTKGKALDTHSSGEVEFQETCFTYPMRPGVKVLRGLNLTIKPGQTVALVGQSGCGKSTTVQLLERFYDVNGGVVKVDGSDVREVQLQSLRRLISLVSQEPTLFNMTIRENIVYGLTKQEVPTDVIIDVAKQANIHNFVSALPQGYDTIVGEKATQLSGGQKQRIAIARALIRDPKILLLDEATSALDSESELIVQEALDAARQGRTSIVIAHRLSTIQSADQIVVIEEGRVVEAGKHNELLALKGKYYALYQAQQGQATKS